MSVFVEQMTEVPGHTGQLQTVVKHIAGRRGGVNKGTVGKGLGRNRTEPMITDGIGIREPINDGQSSGVKQFIMIPGSESSGVFPSERMLTGFGYSPFSARKLAAIAFA